MKGQRQTGKPYINCYPAPVSPLCQGLGIALIVSGLLLLFVCIPGWAWAAAAGILLVLLGWLLIRAGSGR